MRRTPDGWPWLRDPRAHPVSRRGYNWVDEKGPIDPRNYSFGGIVVERDVNG